MQGIVGFESNLPRMELRACGSLAQIQILLIPVGPIHRSTYDKWAAEIRAFEEIRLGDIPTDSRDERGMTS